MTDAEPLLDAGPSPARPSFARRLLRGLGSIVLFLALAIGLSTLVGQLRGPGIDGPAPDFALQNLDGETVRLSDFRGQTVVINFWATWCGPCRVEMPSFARFARKNPEIVMLGLAVTSPPNALREAVECYDLPYPVLLADEATYRAYKVNGIPSTLVVGPDGAVRSSHTGVLFGPQLAWMTR
ncbi:MAG: redoxin domain-containing protein [Acidobacteriota bacterium]